MYQLRNTRVQLSAFEKPDSVRVYIHHIMTLRHPMTLAPAAINYGVNIENPKFREKTMV